jgi:hypothetical protein
MRLFIFMAGGGLLGFLFVWVLDRLHGPGSGAGDFVVFTVPAGAVLGMLLYVVLSLVRWFRGRSKAE